MKRLLLLGLMLSCVSCERAGNPTGQIVLYFDTDAPVPMFDSLVVDVYEPGQTVACVRDGNRCSRRFALTADLFRSVERSTPAKPLGASIGIPLRPNTSGYRVRARMFTASATLTGQPPDPRGDIPPQSVVDVFASLPPVAETGVIERTLLLRTSTVGSPQGSLSAPLETNAGRPEHSLVGTWQGARTIPCDGEARADEVCVPGGAFWMGNPRTRGTHYESDLRRLVVVSPFFLQRTEVTVRQLRDAKPSVTPTPWSGGSSGTQSQDYCTYTTSPGPHEDLPVNCLTFDAARAFCESLGSELPTEAQFEYVESARVGALYPWGDVHEPTCDDASFGRGGWGLLMGYEAPCKIAQPGGPAPVQSKALDKVTLPGGDIFDLAGNIEEWTLDLYNRQDEPCWSGAGPFTDPLCTTPSDAEGAKQTARGGYWFADASSLAASVRAFDIPTIGRAHRGVRCARPGR